MKQQLTHGQAGAQSLLFRVCFEDSSTVQVYKRRAKVQVMHTPSSRCALGELRPGFEFTHQFVIVPLERPYLSENPVMPRNDDTLIHRIDPQSRQGVIIGFRIERAKNRWLITSNAGHFCLPDCVLGMAGIWNLFYFGQQVIIVALQCLVIPRFAGEIKDQLHSTYYSSRKTGVAAPLVEINRLEQVSGSRRAKNDDEEAEPTVPAIERKPSGSVVKCITQHVQADQVSVCSVLVHMILIFSGVVVMGSADVARLARHSVSASSLMAVEGRALSSQYLPFTIVSMWFGHWGCRNRLACRSKSVPTVVIIACVENALNRDLKADFIREQLFFVEEMRT